MLHVFFKGNEQRIGITGDRPTSETRVPGAETVGHFGDGTEAVFYPNTRKLHWLSRQPASQNRLRLGRPWGVSPRSTGLLPRRASAAERPQAGGGTVPRRLVSPPKPTSSVGISCDKLPKFSPSEHLEFFGEFVESNWARQGASPTLRSVNEYIRYLYPYAACEPGAPPTVVERPRPVGYSCDGPFWSGPRAVPKKIVSFVPFAYELDILEVRLFEHEDVVDLTVLSESVYTHRVTRKPLVYERNKERFARFADGILHVVDDEAPFFLQRGEPHRAGDDWRNELRMRSHPWQKFLQATGLRHENMSDYLLLSTDLDEIPSAEQLAHFKYCQPRSQRQQFALAAVFYSHNFRHVRPTREWQGIDVSATLIEAAAMAGKAALPRKGGQPYFDHKGWVMNRMFNSYADMFKDLALAEGGNIPQKRPRELASDPLLADRWRSRGVRTCCFSDEARLRPPPPGHRPPWYAALNKERFPYMFAAPEAPAGQTRPTPALRPGAS